MVKKKLSEQLDQAVEAIIAAPDAQLPPLAAGSDSLVRIAVELRHLPSLEFKTRLKEDLKRRALMTTTTATTFREGFHTITPYIIVNEAAELIEFVKEAFGAVELFRTTGSAGGLHCEVRISDSIVMIGGGGAWRGTPTPTALLVYVDDVETTYRNALRAGAMSLREPMEEEYGDRDAGVRDRFGNNWYISTKRALEHNPPDLRSIALMLSFDGAAQAINFMKRAFGAEEAYRAESPEGEVVHAKIRIGDSLLALSESHGPYQPMPSTLFLYVDDVDAWHRRAVSEGAASLTEPTDQPYGDRVGGVTDPFGNVWYLATPIQHRP